MCQRFFVAAAQSDSDLKILMGAKKWRSVFKTDTTGLAPGFHLKKNQNSASEMSLKIASLGRIQTQNLAEVEEIFTFRVKAPKKAVYVVQHKTIISMCTIRWPGDLH